MDLFKKDGLARVLEGKLPPGDVQAQLVDEQGRCLEVRGLGRALVAHAINENVIVPNGPASLRESRGVAVSHCVLRMEALSGVRGRDSLQIPYMDLLGWSWVRVEVDQVEYSVGFTLATWDSSVGRAMD